MSEETTSPGTTAQKAATLKYLFPLIAVLGGTGGVGGFLGSQSTTAELSRTMDEVRSDVKDIQRQFTSGDKAAALLERDVSELRTQVAEMRDRLDKMERRR